MLYNGQILNLKEYLAEREEEYVNKPAWYWHDEGLVYAMQDYYSSMGEFSDEDWEYIKEMELQEIAAMCEEDF